MILQAAAACDRKTLPVSPVRWGFLVRVPRKHLAFAIKRVAQFSITIQLSATRFRCKRASHQYPDGLVSLERTLRLARKVASQITRGFSPARYLL
eukprot:993897-Prorocentrum_minimum.AAC.3